MSVNLRFPTGSRRFRATAAGQQFSVKIKNLVITAAAFSKRFLPAYYRAGSSIDK
jgi:hypothetical protein